MDTHEHRRRALALTLCLLSLPGCGIPRQVWDTLASQPGFTVNTVTLDNPPASIANGATATLAFTVVFVCEGTGAVEPVAELWDSDLEPVDPDELLSWRRETVLCQPPPTPTTWSSSLSLRCINGNVWGFNTTDPDGQPNVPDSGEGTTTFPFPGQAEIYARSQGSSGPARRSGEHHVSCT